MVVAKEVPQSFYLATKCNVRIAKDLSTPQYQELPTMDIRSIITRRMTGKNRRPILEDSVKKAMKKLYGDIFLDVGANVGDYTVLLSQNFRQVVAIEANPETAVALKNRLCSVDRRVIIVETAIGDFDGETKFYLNQDPSRASGSADTIESEFHYRPSSNPNLDRSDWNHKEITIKMQKLDTLTKTLNGSIDLVKIDVEGAEFKVLKGAEETLNAGRIKRILVELHDRTRMKELETLLVNQRFSFKWLDADHVFGNLNK